MSLEALHTDAGARFVEIAGWRLPAHYGGDGPTQAAVAAEYTAAREATGLVELSERGVLAATGPLRLKLLHGIFSNDIQGCAPGQGCLAALMNAKGRLQALVRALVTDDAVLLEATASRIDEIERQLVHYRVAAPVRFERHATRLLAVVGPRSRQTLEAAELSVPELAAESHVVTAPDLRVVRASDLPAAEGYVLHVAEGEVAQLWSRLRAAGAVPVGRWALDALRIETGCAWYGEDVTEQNLLHETGLVKQYHSPTKGCYVGQEVIARLEARGSNVSKALRGLKLEGPVTAGDPIAVGEKSVGQVTTAAVSPRFGPIALGYVHRSHLTPGSEVSVAGVAGQVSDLPFGE